MIQLLETPDNEDTESRDAKEEIRGRDIQDVTIFPPEDGAQTDEDSDEENTRNLNHLTASQLTSVCEVTTEVREAAETENETSEKKRPSRNRKKDRLWKANVELPRSSVLEQNVELNDTVNQFMTPTDCFELCFDESLVKLLVDMSNMYANQRNYTLNVTVSEMKVYIGILLLTGYLSPKNIRMFWETKSDTHNELVSGSMRRGRFLEIHRYLHTCNNHQLPKDDKFSKVREYLDHLNKCFVRNAKYVMNTNDISIDETMVPYYGHHGSKQHIHGKPIRFGYKLWSAATPGGYLIYFIPYQGSKAAALPDQEKLGLGASVVMCLTSHLPKAFKFYSLYFDNFFTGLPLLDKLTELGHRGTGTIRENRTEKCPLETSKEMKKKPRGAISMRTAKDISVVRWHDNNIVTLASNSFGCQPITKVDRVASVNKKRQKVKVDCPYVVTQYNKFMGGVDRFDQNIDDQRVSFRGRKWWYPLLAFGIDAACQNGWQIHRKCGHSTMTYCEFRRSIVQGYLGTYKTPPTKSPFCGGKGEKRVHQKVRTDADISGHVQESCNQARCAECHQRTRIMCKKCNVPLHVHCFYVFHNK